MFSFFKKKNINLALEYFQNHHKKVGLGQELSPEMLNMVIQTPLFKDINNRFSSMGLSHYGGLAWFSSQTIGTILEKIKEGQEVSDNMYLLSEKMANISLSLANSIHSLKLTKNDLAAILNTGEVATEWLDLTRTPEQEKFMADMLGH